MKKEAWETYHSKEYDEYYERLDMKTKTKFDYMESIIKTQYVVSTKFVKKLDDTEFYEARVSVGTNEHRTVIFAIDSDSFMESKRVLFLNSFLKKDTKQYVKEIEKARRILENFTKEEKNMINIDEEKLAKLTTGSDHLRERYGEKGSLSREGL